MRGGLYMSFNLGLDMTSLIIGSGVGLIKTHIENQAEIKKQQQELLAKDKIQNRASNNKFYQWTRRIIALTLVFSVVLYPVIAAYTNIPFYVPYIESHGFIMSIFTGDADIVFKEVNGLVMPPILIPCTMYIMGFYFSAPTKRV
jgi:hypothetical protein